MKDFKVVFIYPNLRGMNTPQFPKEKIKGIVRTFSLYARFDKSRWQEIAAAEKDTPEGNAQFEKLRKEFIETYFQKTGTE